MCFDSSTPKATVPAKTPPPESSADSLAAPEAKRKQDKERKPGDNPFRISLSPEATGLGASGLNIPL